MKCEVSSPLIQTPTDCSGSKQFLLFVLLDILLFRNFTLESRWGKREKYENQVTSKRDFGFVFLESSCFSPQQGLFLYFLIIVFISLECQIYPTKFRQKKESYFTYYSYVTYGPNSSSSTLNN